MFLIFDTETTGLPKRWDAPISDLNNWPRVVQLAWQLHDEDGSLVSNKTYVIKPVDFDIPFESEKVHGISTLLATQIGEKIQTVFSEFLKDLSSASYIVGHNLKFDINVVSSELYRLDIENQLLNKKVLDTCTENTANVCKLPGGKSGKFKFPTLVELYENLFNKQFENAHNASADVEANAMVFFELIRQKLFDNSLIEEHVVIYQKVSEKFKEQVSNFGIAHTDLKEESKKLKQLNYTEQETNKDLGHNDFKSDYVHLHNNSQFSILQSTTKISDLVKKTSEQKMSAVALTDKANMMGCFHFYKAVKNYNDGLNNQNKKIKPILGCELNVCENRLDKSYRDDGYQIVFLAKNKVGYENLMKMCSIGYTEGFYYVPRIDKDLVKKYRDGLIVLSGSKYGEISNKIINVGEKQASDACVWWKENFSNDFYLEMNNHGEEENEIINAQLSKFSKIHGVKLIATNNTKYISKEDANAHDILLCVKDGQQQSTPIGRGRGFRYGLKNQEYYFKTKEEMSKIFENYPDAINNISELVDKVEFYDLSREVLLPKFSIPDNFKSKSNDIENEYLKYLTYEGADHKYEKINDDLKEKIDFELGVIKNSGYPGYFLIVQDLINAAKEMGVSVGPGRGSVAGSIVAYCLGITKIDPIKYDLLFERFLNPDRVSMPDIDIDFDDDGRGKVIDYVIEKYGSNQVAQIVTYGKMAAKSSIRDTARVLDLSLSDADYLAKLVPNMTKLSDIFESDKKKLSSSMRSDDFSNAVELKNIADGDNLQSETINQARVLEGSLRNVGVHACGVIITPDEITKFVPIATAKDSDLVVTQYDNSVVENAGLLKMDFLGLKTLTLIKDTIKLIKYRHKKDIDIDNIPLDDLKTYELFQKGDTVGIFQYESLGMQKYLRDLKPTVFEDLIAMNALYRPGPLEYIPSFVRRKNGTEEIKYDIPEMEEFLKETYGITVYQEQVMQLSQKLANFSKGDADTLRKAMGKKIFSLLEKLKPKFIKGGKSNGYDSEILEKIWKDWEAFASYAFNKSHSTCYALIAYQTAYLKAHYPSEYMAAVLSNNMNDIKQVSFFMEECKYMSIDVLGPDINESIFKFNVNENNSIRFGMGAVKGVGQSAVKAIVEGRKSGKYKSIFDFAKRVDLRSANKKAFDSLVLAGAFDSVDKAHRAQYFYENGDGVTFVEKAIRFGSKFQERENSPQTSLFSDADEIKISEPNFPECDKWSKLDQLKKEKNVVGIYISGHPLDDYLDTLKFLTNIHLNDLKDLRKLIDKEVRIGGIIGEVQHKISKNGRGWATFIIEDYFESYELRIFGEDYLKFKHFLVENNFVHIKMYIKEGWKNAETGRLGDPRIQFLNFQQLQDTLSSNTKKISIKIDAQLIEEDHIDYFKKLVKKHKGDQEIVFNLSANGNGLDINLYSVKNKVKITEELIKSLKEKKLEFRLN
ncbi:DNA polymerase III subunit alpha [Flavobacteriales bacterium]|nr:DNA polymerase III subunit alpha [Flavobacteriales bacterium]